MSTRASAAWNPLRCTGTALPPQLLLVAKLLVLSLILNGYVQGLPARWLPMWSIFDAFSPESVRHGLQLLFSLAAIALLFNQWVRAASFLAGLVFFFEPIVCRTHYYYADVFCALVLMLIGLHQSAFGTRLVRWQFTVMYFGSGLNKLLDPDWRDGVFMQNFLTTESTIFPRLDAHFPDMFLAHALSWGTIAIELGAALALLSPRLWRYAIWVLVVFHSASVFFVGLTFGVFLSALLAAYPAFATWYEPGEVVVEYQPQRRWQRLLQRISTALDPDGLFLWTPGPELCLSARSESWRGLAAVRRWMLLTPAVYVAFVAFVASPKTVGKILQHVAPFLLDAHWKLAKGGLILLALFLAPLPLWNAARRPRTELSSTTGARAIV